METKKQKQSRRVAVTPRKLSALGAAAEAVATSSTAHASDKGVRFHLVIIRKPNM